MHPALLQCLRAPTSVPTTPDIAQWWAGWKHLTPAAPDPAGRAIAGGFGADRMAWAFASGYQAALRALVPQLAWDRMAAFCVTEADGNRPRDIRTTIVAQPDGALRIDGAKRWAMLGPEGAELLVVGVLPAGASADASPADAAPSLGVVRVSVPSSGVVPAPMPPARFIPELPHATITLQDVRLPAQAQLPGDGYARYVKPFRTHEDVHVTLAVLAYLLREARARHWPPALAEALVGAMALFVELANEDASAPETHIALAGALQIAERLYADAGLLWSNSDDPETAARWERDAVLFNLSGKARQLRTVRAWERVETGR